MFLSGSDGNTTVCAVKTKVPGGPQFISEDVLPARWSSQSALGKIAESDSGRGLKWNNFLFIIATSIYLWMSPVEAIRKTTINL